MEDAIYVCELCQKHGKVVQSLPSLENGKTQVSSSQEEHKTVPSDTKLSPQLPWSHGKVCNLITSNDLAFPSNKSKLINITDSVTYHTCIHRLHIPLAKSINLRKLFLLFLTINLQLFRVFVAQFIVPNILTNAILQIRDLQEN
jgi:hypothetical protein